MKNKNINIGKIFLLIGAILLIVGIGLNVYTTMNTSKSNNSQDKEDNKVDNLPKPNDEETKKEVVIPNDMEKVSTSISNNLGKFLLISYTTSDSGVDILKDPSKRLNLIYLMLEQTGDFTQSDDGMYNYASLEFIKHKYEEVYGSTDNFDSDLENGYSLKSTIDSLLGQDFIGWNSTWPIIGVERTYKASSVDYNKDTAIFTINGTYSDNQLGTTTETGKFIITYKDNCLISITLTNDNV